MGIALLILAVIGFGALMSAALAGGRLAEQSRERRRWVASVRHHHDVKHVISDNHLAFGLDPARKRFVVVKRNGDGSLYSYDHIAAVLLTPTYITKISSTAETKSRRGSQIVSAGLGAAVAGPAGLVVGGLSGSTTTTTHGTSHEELQSLELEVRLFCDDQPRTTISVDAADEKEARDFAARLANIIEQRVTQPAAMGAPIAIETELIDPEAMPRQKGWFARTFAA